MPPQIVISLPPGSQGEYDYCVEVIKHYDPGITDNDIVLHMNYDWVSYIDTFYNLYKDEVNPPILMSPTTVMSLWMEKAFNYYPKIHVACPLTGLFSDLPKTITLSPDKIPCIVTAGGNRSGYNDWFKGNSLEFTDDAFYMWLASGVPKQYDTVTGVTQDSSGVTKIKLGAAQLNYCIIPYVTGTGSTNGWWVHISGVAGFQHNPNGHFKVQGKGTPYPNEYILINHDLGTGSWTNATGNAFQNYLSGVISAVVSKWNRIRRERACSLIEARLVAQLTASNDGNFSADTGYGIIDTSDAISYADVIPDDPLDILGDIGTLEQEWDGLESIFTWEAVDNAKLYKLYRNGIVIYSGTNLTFTSVTTKVGSNQYKYKAFRDTQETDFSNQINITIMGNINVNPVKYATGKTVYFLDKGAVQSGTILKLLPEVSNPANDNTGKQENRYIVSGRSLPFPESLLAPSPNTLLGRLKGAYLNDGYGAYGVDIILDVQLNDIAWLDHQGNNIDGSFSGKIIDGCNFTGATLPNTADTKAEMKALVASYDPVTTIWTDGQPIGA